MKILLLYLVLCFLGLAIIVTVDLLSGMGISTAFQSIHSILATTTIQESIIMVVFLSLPFITAIASFFKKRSTTTK